MPADYNRVSPTFWRHTAGWEDDQRILALYLLTNDHRDTEGLYYLPKGYVRTDLDKPRDVIDSGFAFLEQAGFMKYDDDVQVVFLCAALKDNPPATERQIKGAVKRLLKVPRGQHWPAFLNACERHAPKLMQAIRMECPEVDATHSNGLDATHSNALSQAEINAFERVADKSSSSSSIKAPKGALEQSPNGSGVSPIRS